MPETRIHVDRPGPGEVVRAVIDGQPVAVWNVEGSLHALSDICPHRGFVLSEGDLLRLRSGRLSVVCPGHHWHFDLETGEAAFRPECLKVFGVEEDGEGTWVVDPDVSPGSEQPGEN